jgi:hypothetical protein
MTTFAPNQDNRDELTDLHGREYDVAEVDSWDRLQDALRDIEADRATLPTGADPHT